MTDAGCSETKNLSPRESGLNILATLNAGYLPQLSVMLSSLLYSNPDARVTLYLLHSSLEEEQLAAVRTLLGPGNRLAAIRADSLRLDSAPVTGRYPQEMYYRIFAAHYLPEELERVLYLDPDIVVNGSLRELYEMPLGDSLFAAATHIRKMMHKLNALRLDMEEEGLYVNSGVMLMNLAQLRREQDCGEVYRYIEEHRSKLLLPDQDIISGLYGARILPVDPFRYNMTERLFILRPQAEAWLDLDWVREHSAIIHYCGRNKPWKSSYAGQLGVFYNEAEARLRRGESR